MNISPGFHPRATGGLLLVVGILLIAACLRTPITSVAPIVSHIRQSFALSTAAAGALTTLPLLAFALAGYRAGVICRAGGNDCRCAAARR